MTTYRETYQPTIMDWEKNVFLMAQVSRSVKKEHHYPFFLMAAIIPCSKVGKMRSPEAEYSHQSWRILVPPPKQWLQYFQRKNRMDFGF